jgi:Cu/Ag efflux protein CusF
MGRLFTYTIIAGLIFSAGSSIAVTNGDIYGINTAPEITEIICKVTDIKGDTLKAKDTMGETYEFKTDDIRTFEGLKTGDNIHVELKNGKAVSTYK